MAARHDPGGLMALRIAIDGYNLAMQRGTGVATYGFALAKQITSLGHIAEGVFGISVGKDPATRELAFFDQFARERRETRWQSRIRSSRTFIRACLPAKLVEVPISDAVAKESYAERLPPLDRIWSSPELFDVARRHFKTFGRFLTVRMPSPPDIMHWTYPVPVQLAGSRNIYTLHDLVPLRLPYTTADYKKEYYRLIERCVADSVHICTVSEASRDDILTRFPVSPDKVTNTYQAAIIPEEVMASDAQADARMVEGIFGLKHRGYFLYFGAIDPKKNLGRVVEGYLSTRSETPLVIVGGRNWGEDAQFKGDGVNIYGHQVNDRIKRLDYLPKPLLFRLIGGAKAVVFPSLFEGFGLPALEALELGTPVITSNVSSLPEIVGDAGLLVDPYSVVEIGDAILRLDGDPGLCADLISKGRKQADKFSKEAYGRQLATMYDQVAQRPL